jgi:hypothetical protein
MALVMMDQPNTRSYEGVKSRKETEEERLREQRRD